MAMTTPACPPFVPALQRRLQAASDTPVELIETHISCVLLTRDRAYKIKKPLTLPFLDYGSVDARRDCCEAELRLNQRLAPQLYLGVCAITGPADAPQLDGDGPLLDWAVVMRRFPHGALFSARVASGTLAPGEIDRLAARLVRFHAAAPAATHEPYGQPSLRRAAAFAAADALAARGFGTPLHDWLQAQAQALAPLWAARRAAGRVREGHGDLHLANLLSLDGDVTAFDAIEFDPALRWIDVLDDVAFVAMDLIAHGRRDLAWRFVNAWLELTGDHNAVPALRFSMVYRALVRAEVATLRTGGAALVTRYLDTARALAHDSDARLLITHGLPGAGKTFVSQQLLERAGAVRVRSDVERKRLFGVGALEGTRALGAAVYADASTERTYARLLDVAALVLRAGHPVIVDAAFLRRAERERAATVAHDLGVPFTIVDCQAAADVLTQRVQARAQRADDASEADLDVLRKLAPLDEPIGEPERAHTIGVDTGGAFDVDALVAAWRAAR